jgi:hypothetical protein
MYALYISFRLQWLCLQQFCMINYQPPGYCYKILNCYQRLPFTIFTRPGIYCYKLRIHFFIINFWQIRLLPVVLDICYGTKCMWPVKWVLKWRSAQNMIWTLINLQMRCTLYTCTSYNMYIVRVYVLYHQKYE